MIYAAYKAPHPLEPVIMIKVQTAQAQGDYRPMQALKNALEKTRADLESFSEIFQNEVSKARMDPNRSNFTNQSTLIDTTSTATAAAAAAITTATTTTALGEYRRDLDY